MHKMNQKKTEGYFFCRAFVNMLKKKNVLVRQHWNPFMEIFLYWSAKKKCGFKKAATRTGEREEKKRVLTQVRRKKPNSKMFFNYKI